MSISFILAERVNRRVNRGERNLGTKKHKKIKLTPPRVLAGGFAMIIAIGTLLLRLPVAAANGKALPLIDAIFTAASATCVTGLAVVDTGTRFSTFGQIVLLAMVQLGGIGFMTMATWFALALKRRVSLQDRLVLMESMNHSNMDSLLGLIVRVFLYSVSIEGVAALFFAIRWSVDMPVGRAVYFGIFHAVSIFNNAGFELIGDNRGLTPFVSDYGINIVTILLILLGGIGFIVMSDLMAYRRTRRLSLHTKVVLFMTTVLTVLGAVGIYIFEYTNANSMSPLAWDTKMLASLFHSVSLRSAGVSTLDVGEMRSATQFLMIVLMFIGAAPGSTGGGIKMTTFAILAGALIATVRGKEDVVLLRHRICKGDVYKAITLTLIGVFLLVIAVMLLSLLQEASFLSILFEAASAFGTVGLSMGLTSSLTIPGKIIVVTMMFIGRIGLLTLAFALQSKPQKELYRYPEGKIIIG